MFAHAAVPYLQTRPDSASNALTRWFPRRCRPLEPFHRIVVRFEREEGLTLSIVDDGVGLPAEIRYGRGLGHLERRARDIGGRLIFTRQDPGRCLVLTLPVSPSPCQEPKNALGTRRRAPGPPTG